MKRKNVENRLSVTKAAELMGVSAQFLRISLQQGSIPFGLATKMSSRWTYVIFKEKFTECTGIKC